MTQVYPEPTVGALIINNKKEILLVKSHKWLNNKYSVPGGHVEIGESFEEAIIREDTLTLIDSQTISNKEASKDDIR